MAVPVFLTGTIRKISGFFLPGGLVFFLSLVAVRKEFVDPWLPQILEFGPYIVLIIGFLLGLRFHTSRQLFMVFILIFGERLLYYFGPGGVIGFADEKLVLKVTSILLPINLALFYFFRERGVFNLRGLVKFFFILVQPLVVYYLFTHQPEVFKYLDRNLVSSPYLDSLALPQSVVLVNGTLMVLFFIGALFSRRPVLSGSFWSLLAAAAALYGINTTAPAAPVYFSTAGIIIILSMVEAAYAMAYRDDLTGLPARRALNNTLQGLGRRYSIAMLDIDFFKKFNDRYGHDVGDQVLCMVASHIGRVGGGGKSFRYGGEEFTVVFPGKSKSDVIAYLERLRESIAGAKFALRGKARPKKRPSKKKRTKTPKKVSVTISIGVAESGPKLSKPSQVIKAADKALYRAKKKGRNRVAA